MAVLFQRQRKGGAANAAKAIAPAGHAAHTPARGAGAGAAQSLLPQQQGQGAIFLCHQIQSPRGGEIGGFACARHFTDHGTDAGAAQAFFHRPERILGRARTPQQKPRWRDPEQIQAHAIRRAAFQRRDALLNPHQGTPPLGTRHKSQRETGCRTQMKRTAGHDLVQTPPIQSATQRRIQCRHSQGEGMNRCIRTIEADRQFHGGFSCGNRI